VDRAYGIRTVAIPDAKLVTKGRFVLAAKGPVAPERLGAVFPAQVKVAPINEIAYLVRQNLTGIPINLVPQRPEEIPYHEGFVYFGLDRHHKFWKEIGKSSEFAFHISGDAGLELEMWVIKEDE
jgi:type VI secretion system protein ImpJ